MKSLRKVRHDLQSQIDEMIKNLFDNCKAEYIKKIDISNIKGYIADVKRGQSYVNGSRFTVPLWAFDRRYFWGSYGEEGYFKYYVAHELAHQIRFKAFDINGDHDFSFYKVFRDICPKELQRYELNYKKTASKFGVGV